MANIFQMSGLKNNPHRSDFDLSRKNLFSMKVGEAVPASCREIIPGDKFEIKPQNFTRTIAVNSAAYTTLREYYDYYFVPTRVLWRFFPDWIDQQNDQLHTAASSTGRVELNEQQPFFTTEQLHEYIIQLRRSDPHQSASALGPTNMFGFARASLTVKLLQYLGYGDFTQSLECDPNGTKWNALYQQNLVLNPFPLLSYQAVCDHFMRNTQWSSSHPYLFNVDYLNGSGAPQFDFTPLLSSDNLPNVNFMDLQYALYHKDYFMGVYPDSQFGDVAVVTGNVDASSLNSFGVTTSYGVSGSDMQVLGLSPNDERLRSFSVNDLQAQVSTGQGTYPVSVVGENKGVVGSAGNLEVLGGQGSFTDEQLSKIRSRISVLALRMAEAKQKWSEITMSNYYDYVSQTEAHFGVKPSEILSFSPRWVGGYDSTIGISEVVNQNITDDNKAYIAGKGVGTGQTSFEFDAEKFGNEHGYLICIAHAEPLLDYATNNVEKYNLRSLPTDYAIPEYDNVGMQAVNLAELTNSVLSVTPQDLNGKNWTMLGYGPRYYDYKSSFDVVHGIFKKSLSYWVAPVTDDYVKDFLSERSKVPSVNSLMSPNFFKIDPHLTDSIFGVIADESVDTDTLLVNFYEDVKASRPLSKYGLPY